MTNTVLSAFAARNDRDEPVSDWLYAVEEHLRDRTVWTEFDEDSELRLSVYQTINTLHPSDEELAEAQRTLKAFSLVVDDQRESDEDNSSDGELLRYVRNILILPENPPVPGGTHLDDDGSELSAAYRVVLTADATLVGDEN
jgi:hypothetical protein